LALNKTAVSFAVKLLGTSRAELKVSRFASPPEAGITNTSKVPYLSDANAMTRPSWLQTGANSYDSLIVKGIAEPPADGTDQMSPLYSKSIDCPSGDIAGYLNHSASSCENETDANNMTASAKYITSFISEFFLFITSLGRY
jgi:hypothetical protein